MDVLERFHEGGFFMWFILAMGIYAFYLFVDRAYALFIKAKPISESYHNQVRTLLKNGDLSGAREFAKSQPDSTLSPIVAIACEMRERSAGDDELQSRLDEALSEKIHEIDKRTAFLAVVGNVATLLGLLGTISGMITSFSAVSGATATERAAMLSMGISEAMNCTAFGLLVAIPALMSYAFFQSKTESVINALTENVSKIYNDLVYLYEPGVKAARR